MDKFPTFKAFYRRVTYLKALFWVCLVLVILFNCLYIIIKLIMTFTKFGRTSESVLGLDQRTAKIVFTGI